MKRILFPYILIITLIAANIELDIYVPALPDMLRYFATTHSHLQWILSINFIGVAISSLSYGPLSDYFGRRKIIIIGLTIFIIGSIGCVFSYTLSQLILWRFIQGLGSSAPAVIGFAAIAEIYEEKKAAQFISIANSVITGSMAAAPLIGNYLTIVYGWRANFIFILILAFISLVGMYFVFMETKKHSTTKPLNFKSILMDYTTLVKDFKFLCLGIIPCLMYVGLIVYIANLSLLFVGFMDVAQSQVGYYQAAIMFTFLIFSFIAALILPKFKLVMSQKIGLAMVSTASLLLLLVALFIQKNPSIITIVMALFSAGAAIALGPFISQALNAYPKQRGTSSAFLGTVRLALSAVAIAIAGQLFNGTLLPIALIIVTMMLASIVMYAYIPHD